MGYGITKIQINVYKCREQHGVNTGYYCDLLIPNRIVVVAENVDRTYGLIVTHKTQGE